jgi:hypothetical protein
LVVFGDVSGWSALLSNWCGTAKRRDVTRTYRANLFCGTGR